MPSFTHSLLEFLTVREAAALMKLSSKTIRRLIKETALPATRIPTTKGEGRWRIDRRDVIAMLPGVKK